MLKPSCATGMFSSTEGSMVAFQVAADGMAGPERAGWITRPSVAKIASASSATAAIARARSVLNCLRSALRLAVISSEVGSVPKSCYDISLRRDTTRDLRFPLLFLIFICRDSQLGSLLDRSPLPKNPRLHKIDE